MSKVVDGLVQESANELEIVLYDSDAAISCTCELGEVVLVEWEGYPEEPWQDATWFMVDTEDDETLFVDLKDMGERTRNFILDRCEGISTGSVDQDGSEYFRDEVE